MKNFIAFSIFFLIPIISLAQQFNGTWNGELSIQGQSLPLIFHINDDGNSAKATMDSPKQGAEGIPVDNVAINNDSIIIEMTALGLQYKGKLTKENFINGVFSQGNFTAEMNLKKELKSKSTIQKTTTYNRPQTPRPKFNYAINNDISIVNKEQGDTLAGTLTTPYNASKNTPIVIMITGSGVQDRDETIFEHKPFMVIADYFAKNGISAIRFDDRGFGKSSKGNIAEPTTYDLATDIEAAIQYLKNQGYKNIGLMGHSEGGIIAGIVSEKYPNLKFSILLSAPVIKGVDIINLQVERLAKAKDIPQSKYEPDSILLKKALDFTVLYNGDNFKQDFEKELISIISELPEEYQQSKDIIIKSLVEGYSSNWYQTFLKLDPTHHYFKSNVNTLAIFGTKDLQVPHPENYNAMVDVMMKKSNNNIEVLKFEGLNHLLQHAEKGTIDEYETIEETIAPEVMKAMVEFIKSNTK